MKKILLLVVPIAIVVGIFIFKEYNRTTPSTANLNADFTLDANTLFDTYDSNEEEANEKYLNKVLLISGKVDNVNKQDDAVQIILLADNAMIGGINCELQDINESEVLPEPGDEVQIKGICQGYLMNVIVNQSVIVE